MQSEFPSVNWLDCPLPFQRCSGPAPDTFDAIVTDLTANPIVEICCGDPFVEVGMLRFLSAVVQIIGPPADDDEKVAWMGAPPSRQEFRAALEKHRNAFEFTHPQTPFFQVQPPLGEEPEGWHDVVRLLPQTPTVEASKTGSTVFADDAGVTAVGLALMPGLLVAHQELFPSGGGGYFGLPHGADSIKFFVTGPRLWHSILANVLPQDHSRLVAGPWPAPCDERTWPWLDPRLAALAPDRISDNKRKKLVAAGHDVPDTLIKLAAKDRHPAAMAMPRRYRLGKIDDGICGLSGLGGPVVQQFARWPQGIVYAPEDWWHPLIAWKISYRREGDTWKKRPPEPLKVNAPLRFSDWLHGGYGEERDHPDEGKLFHTVRPADAVHHMCSIRGELSEMMKGTDVTATFDELPFTIRAVAQFAFGKAVGGMSMRELPFYSSTGLDETSLPQAADQFVEIAEKVGSALRRAVKAATASRADAGSKNLPNSMCTALIAGLEPVVLREFGNVRNGAPVIDCAFHLAREARDSASQLFDETFPLFGVDAGAVRIVQARAELHRMLGGIVRRYMPVVPKPVPAKSDRTNRRRAA